MARLSARRNKQATAIDRHVGGRLRRTMLGLSQTELARLVGITFQQVQKYEQGTNRIGASRLYEFADVLGVTVAHFYEGLEEGRRATPPEESDERLWLRRETLELARAYSRITRPPVREQLLRLVEAVAQD